ncbi:hypothetical protein TPHA_0P00370 [Tetrapisispora phaffii CBS 4417]|uniref:Ubiquitin-like protease family profile domain-containing protein n=1 Tax=Tetrapisispora phaffii (strain ATCC 24235 / CBS 4417 / NBRC 1672 / NRRL Y-8282 / UCD 70-5) TaxID=1071381 RepID=G8C217_TETPH|nr:hypothetical protein TPHA_0P00370 [Tetrapisispora phaffii CBS 4417]CCE66195.1 hypothetical protein TPHA_0P00370 [Tetrapisispora phaffii CBS 4417]
MNHSTIERASSVSSYYNPSFSKIFLINSQDVRNHQRSRISRYSRYSARQRPQSSSYEYNTASEIAEDLKVSFKAAGKYFWRKLHARYGSNTRQQQQQQTQKRECLAEDLDAADSTFGGSKRPMSVSHVYYISSKRRKLDSPNVQDNIGAHSLPTYLSIDVVDSSRKDSSAGIGSKDPFKWATWSVCSNQDKNCNTKHNYATSNYGSAFISNKHSSEPNQAVNPEDPIEKKEFADCLKTIYEGKNLVRSFDSAKEDIMKDLSLSNIGNHLNSTTSFKLRIAGLTKQLKDIIVQNQDKEPIDDLIVVKERKISPLEKKRNEFYRHVGDVNKALLDYKKYTKSYADLLKKQREARKAYLSKKSQQDLIPSISASDLNEIQQAFNANDNKLLSKGNNLEVYVRDLITLRPGAWLNDTIIEFFMQTIEANDEACVAFNSFFYTTLSDRGYPGVRRWLKRKKKNIDNLDKIFVPVNLNRSHWALCMIDLKNKRIIYVDSLSNGPNATSFAILSDLQHFVWEASEHKYGKDFELVNADCPQQPNGFDCGVFVCMNAFYLENHSELTYKPSDASRMRLHIANLILHSVDKK